MHAPIQLLTPGARSAEAQVASPSPAGAAASAAVYNPPNLSATPAEIVELARALKNDPSLIFQFVHDNIEFEPIYGAVKGPLGTLLDRRGGAFDQSALLVALLQQASLTNTAISNIQYQFGTLQLSGPQFASWLDTDNDYGSIEYVLESGGYPSSAISNFQTTSSPTVTTGQVGHVWVSALVSGTTVVYDPAFKLHTKISGFFDTPGSNAPTLGSIMGYTQAGLTSAAGGTLGSNPLSFNGTKRAAIRSAMAGYATTLAGCLKVPVNSGACPVFAGGSVADIVGGTTISPAGMTSLGATNPNQAPASTVTSETPVQFAADTARHGQVSVQLPGWSGPVTYYADTIYDHRLTVVFTVTGGTAAAPVGAPTLYLDGVAQGPGGGNAQAGTAQGGPYNISVGYVTPWSPYVSSMSGGFGMAQFCGGAALCTRGLTPNSTYLIAAGFGQVGQGTIERHRELLAQAVRNGAAASSEQALGESLSVLAYTWLGENAARQQLSDQIVGAHTSYAFGIGIAGQAVGATTQGPYVDLPWNLINPVPRLKGSTASSSTDEALFYDYSKTSSGFEAGVLRQIYGQQIPNFVAASTTYLLDTAIGGGATIYDFTSATFTAANQAKLTNYSASDIANINGYLNKGFSAILASTGDAAVGTGWKGLGFEAASANMIGEIISGQQSGGFTGSPTPAPTVVASTTGPQMQGQAPPGDAPVSGTAPAPVEQSTSVLTKITNAVGDPVDRQSGGYFYSHDDLVVGSQPFPYGLAFQRQYASSDAGMTGPLGRGWTHNYSYSAQRVSNGFDSLGGTSPAASAAAIAAIYIGHDLMTTYTAAGGNFQRLDLDVIDTVVAQWLIDQLVNNVVVVTQPSQAEDFVLLADGTYAGPLGSANVYASASGGSTYTTPDGVTLSFNMSGQISQWHSPSGPTVTFAYNGANLMSVANGMGRTLSVSYSGPNISSVSDGSRSVSYGYDGNGNLSVFTDALGGTTKFAYDTSGTYDLAASHLKQVFYPASSGGAAGSAAFVTNNYDTLGRVKTQQDADGNTSSYYIAGARAEFDDPIGIQHIWFLDTRGNVQQETYGGAYNGVPRTWTYALDDAGRLINTTTPSGRQQTFSLDAWNNVLKLTDTPPTGSLDPHPPGTAALAIRMRCFAYDAVFHKIAIQTDWTAYCNGGPGATGGDQTTYSYDSSGNLVHVAAPTVPVLEAAATTASEGYATYSATFTSTPTSASPATDYTYNARGQVLTKTEPGLTSATRRVTSYVYDTTTSNRLSLTVDPSGYAEKTSFAYDAAGNVTSITDSIGNATTSTYDALRHMLTKTPPETKGGTSQANLAYTYDGLGNLLRTTATPVSGSLPPRITSATYRPTGKLSTSTDASGRTLTYGYNAAEQVTSIADQTGRTTVYGYDPAGQLNGIADGTGAQIEYRLYDTEGRLFRHDDGAGHCTAYNFDGFDRPSSADYWAGTCYNGAESFENFAYTVNDGMDYHALRSGKVVTATFDVLGRRVSQSTSPTDAANNASFFYDGSGRLTLMTRQEPSALYWDQLAFGSSTEDWLFLYRTDGLRAWDVFPDGKSLSYSYDLDGRPGWTQFNENSGLPGTATGSGYTLATPSYDNASFILANFYDQVGNLTQVQSYAPVGGPSQSVALSGYDPFNREVVRYLGGNVDFTNGTCWTYDAGGSGDDVVTLLQFIGSNYCQTASNVVQLGYAYDKAHRVTSLTTTGLTIARPPAALSQNYGAPTGTNELPSVGASSLSYDADGNLTSTPFAGLSDGGGPADSPKGSATYTFDTFGRLSTATIGSAETGYLYDPLGRLIAKTSVTGGHVNNRFLHDSQGNVAGEYTAAGAAEQRFAYSGKETAPMATYAASDGSYTFNRMDRIGSVVAVSAGPQPGQSFEASGSYLPFGALASGTVPSLFGFAGYMFDNETGLYHTASRFYDPRIGRFITPDPIGYGGGMNYYAYVGNDPVNFSDPSGLFADSAYNVGAAGFGLLRTGAGYVAQGAEVAAEGAAVGAGTVVAAAGTAAAILLYPTSTASNDTCDPPNCGNQYVVRGGAGTPASFQNGTKLGPNGFGFSVQTAPGVSVDQLARGGSFPNNQISVSTTNALQAIPGVTVNAPTPGFGTYHGTVNVPNPPPPGMFNAISGAFTQQPNPYVTPR